MPFFTSDIGKLLIFAGLAIAVIGGLLLLFGRLGFAQLPGTISGGRGSFSFVIPLGASLVVSIVLTVILNIIVRLWR